MRNIPDMVLFLRPTEFPVVFLQQLVRGLRRGCGKEYLNVLDFIGIYEKAGNAPYLLSGRKYRRKRAAEESLQDFEFPDDCLVDFDLLVFYHNGHIKKVFVKIREWIFCGAGGLCTFTEPAIKACNFVRSLSVSYEGYHRLPDHGIL